MNLKWLLGVAIGASTLSPIAAHGADLHEQFRRAPWAPNCVCKWFCDDYCKKPEPAARLLCPPTCCDDYCKKPLPLAKLLCPPTYCDDYCSKPLPPLPCEPEPRCIPPHEGHFPKY